jgi:hypothetical protein
VLVRALEELSAELRVRVPSGMRYQATDAG